MAKKKLTATKKKLKAKKKKAKKIVKAKALKNKVKPVKRKAKTAMLKKRILKKVPKQSRTTPWKVAADPKKILGLRKDFDRKMNRQEIAKKYSCSVQTIYYIMYHSKLAKTVFKAKGLPPVRAA